MYSPNGKLKSCFTGVTFSVNMGNPGNILIPFSFCSFEKTIDLLYVVTTSVFAVPESHVCDSSGPLYLLPSPFPSRELVNTGTKGLWSSAVSATSATSSKVERHSLGGWYGKWLIFSCSPKWANKCKECYNNNGLSWMKGKLSAWGTQ